MDVLVWISLAVSFVSLLIAVGAVGAALAAESTAYSLHYHSLSPAIPTDTIPSSKASGPVCVVYNPTKKILNDEYRQTVSRVASNCGCGEPIWMATDPEDSGVATAKKAIDLEPSVILAAGGDGTVRAVAGALEHSGVPLGLLPVGTGNLLARNLNLPLNLEDAITIALTGRTRQIDVGHMTFERATGHTDLPFVVMAGIGFDASVMAQTKSDLKKKIGWGAYVIAGLRSLWSPRVEVELSMGDGAAPEKIRARTILFANCGKLVSRVVLLPEARIDDGWIDVAALNARGGLLGWLALFARIAGNTFSARGLTQMPTALSEINLRRTNTLTARATSPHEVQIDGDVVGVLSEFTVYLNHSSLLVRC